MQSDEVKSRLTPIFRDIFDNESLVVSDSMTADDVPKSEFAVTYQHDHCG